MRFEARELTPYAEPVSGADLKEGSVYYSVTFVDDEMHIPIMETLVFIGGDLEENDPGKLYFQDVESYRDGIRYASAGQNQQATFFECTEDQLKAIFEYDKALDVFLRCSLGRKGNKQAL